MATKPNLFQLIAFDPGWNATGWAHFVIHFKAFSRPDHRALRYVQSWDCGEFTGSEHDQVKQAVALVHEARWGSMPYVSKVDIVTEDFDLVQLVGGKELLAPVRFNAALDYICLSQYSTELIYQKRQARTQVTPERLRAFGFEGRWVTTGRGKDEFAAMQHAVTWLRHLKHEADRRPWKLENGVTSNARWDCACERRNSRSKNSRQRCDLTHPK